MLEEHRRAAAETTGSLRAVEAEREDSEAARDEMAEELEEAKAENSMSGDERLQEKERVIAALEASTWADHFMPYGPTKFVDGQNTGGRAAMLQASRTALNVVWPNEFAGAKPIYPRPKVS